jgi:hypothetical protein
MRDSVNNVKRYVKTAYAKNDQTLRQVVMLHGPFDLTSETRGIDTSRHICLSCNVDWPCRTYELLEEYCGTSGDEVASERPSGDG